MALRHSAFYSPLLMTMAGGFLRDEGLEPNYVVATAENTVDKNINNGSCHVAQSAVATSFAALERGEEVNIVHFAQINSRDGFFIAARDADDDFDWNKLTGKKVLVDHFFQPLAMLKYALHIKGIEFNRIEAIDAGDVDAIDSAFRDGQADYVHQQGPAPQQLEHDGVGHVVAAVGSVVGQVAFSSLCASRQWLTSDMAQSFMKAYNKSLEMVIHAAAEEIAARQQEAGFFRDIDPDVLIQAIRSYQQLGCWQTSPVISRDAYERLLDVFLFNGTLTKRFAYEKAIVLPPGY